MINDGALMLDAKKIRMDWQAVDGGDIVTADEYENFELNLEWKFHLANSGIIFNVVEDAAYDYVWQTGPECRCWIILSS